MTSSPPGILMVTGLDARPIFTNAHATALEELPEASV
jgi:hypothetical protein